VPKSTQSSISAKKYFKSGEAAEAATSSRAAELGCRVSLNRPAVSYQRPDIEEEPGNETDKIRMPAIGAPKIHSGIRLFIDLSSDYWNFGL
jgi:hypothetical protein